jgi:hypothetical protein
MTERLSALLREEADVLDVPAPPAARVLAQGRGLRRRRRLATAGGSLAVLVLVGGVAALAARGGGDAVDSADHVPAQDPPAIGAAYAVGNVVHVDDGAVTATVADPAVKSLYYTSAGVLVRHGDNAFSDGGGAQRFSLVAPDGTVTPVGVETEETVHATDAAQPYLAYAQRAGGVVEVVVHDVETDTEVARVPVPGASGDFLPVALSGDSVYLSADEHDYVVDWRTGEVTEPGIVEGGPEVAGGHAAAAQGQRVSVLDAETGEVLLTVRSEGYPYLTLSPDGRYAALDPQTEETGFDVYDVDTGEHVRLAGYPYDYGWTSDGRLFTVTETGLRTCDAGTGECDSVTLDAPTGPGEVRLAGRSYES